MSRNENKIDERLDVIVSRLRSLEVPAVPRELFREADEATYERNSNASNQLRPWARHLTWATVTVAAIVLVVTCLFWTVGDDVNPEERTPVVAEALPSASSGEAVQVMKLSQLGPYTTIESELDKLEVELAELKRRASLLDVHRAADLLLAQSSAFGEKQ